MPPVYARDLDLNLLRVFSAVAEVGSVTAAASRLYLTQPAVSAALRRLNTAVGARLFTKAGRGIVLTERGRHLNAAIREHLGPLVEAVLAAPDFDPKASRRTFRLGLSDAAELWLLPALVHALKMEAPQMTVIALPVQFRTVGAMLAEGLDAAVTVADDLPAHVRRRVLFRGSFCALFDPRAIGFKRLSEEAYFKADHVIVSYNGDVRGVVEDVSGRARKVRCSVSSFANLGALLEGNALIATVPTLVADHIRATRPGLKTAPVPLPLAGAPLELLWPDVTHDDGACRYLREKLITLASATTQGAPSARAPGALA